MIANLAQTISCEKFFPDYTRQIKGFAGMIARFAEKSRIESPSDLFLTINSFSQ